MNVVPRDPHLRLHDLAPQTAQASPRTPTPLFLVGLLFGLVTLFSVAVPVAAQVRGTSTNSGGSGHFALGSVRLELDELNGLLSSNGLPTVESSALSFGGGGYMVRGRLVLGGEGHGFLLGDETTADGLTGVRVGGGFGVFVAGMELRPSRTLRVQPRFGIGGGGHSLQIGLRDIPRLDDVLADPGRGVTLSHGGLVRTLGIRIERNMGGTEGGGPVFGFEFGRINGVGSWKWASEWGDVTRGPSHPFEGTYVRGTIGGGGRR